MISKSENKDSCKKIQCQDLESENVPPRLMILDWGERRAMRIPATAPVTTVVKSANSRRTKKISMKMLNDCELWLFDLPVQRCPAMACIAK